jgi:hypothetical protein
MVPLIFNQKGDPMRNLLIGACVVSVMMPMAAFAAVPQANSNMAQPAVNVQALMQALQTAIAKGNVTQVQALSEQIIKADPKQATKIVALAKQSNNPAIKTALNAVLARALANAPAQNKAFIEQAMKLNNDATETAAINNNQAPQQTQNAGAGAGGNVVGQNATQLTASPN